MKRVAWLLDVMICASVLVPGLAEAATLHEQTLKAFESYVALTEMRIADELESEAAPSAFLVIDRLAESERSAVHRRLRAGEIDTRRMKTLGPDGRDLEIPKGMIHHWVGSIFVPQATVEELLPWVTDYDEHHRYFDEVEASRVIARSGDAYEIFLRLRRKKVITVHYNTEHEVVYRRHGPGRVSSRSRATRIAEVENAGEPGEREKPPGDDRGFLWRLNSYWRFEDVDGGVIVECETVSLSRSVPAALRWIVGRYIDSVPRESLGATLEPIRESYVNGTKRTLVHPSSF